MNDVKCLNDEEFVIDKQNGDVIYNDELHVYKSKTDGSKYISVTTLIHKYVNEFDEVFWSRYKTLERIVGEEVFKKAKGGLLSKKVFNVDVKEFGVDETFFEEEVAKTVQGYKDENKKSCDRGTAIHLQMENAMYDKKDFKSLELDKFVGKDFGCVKDNYDLEVENGIFPEYLVYYNGSDGLKVAGQVDLVIKDGNDIYILDYKTNKKLNFVSYRDRVKGFTMMKAPLNNIMDCNVEHYGIQLSTYAYMLKCLYPEFNIKMLRIIYFPHDGSKQVYDLDYKEDEVKRMFSDYNKKIKYEEFNKKHKKIEF